MTTRKEGTLASRHNWFSLDLELKGTGHAHIKSLNADVFGPATITTDKRNKVKVKLQIARMFPDTVHPLEVLFKSHDFDKLEITTPDGRFVATRIVVMGSDGGNEDIPAHFVLTAQDAELIVSDAKPVYWILPLSNFLSRFLRHPNELRTHPLRLKPDQRVMSFTWNGRPAYIEPLLDYKGREKQFEEEDVRNLLTAIMVGEIGDYPTDAISLNNWFPEMLLYVLSFAKGHEIGAPWVEFRDIDGKLCKRVYRHMGSPTFTSGHCVLEDLFGHHTANLLGTAEATPFCEKAVFRVLLHHAIRAGAGRQTIDDRLSHLFRAFDRLCQEHGIKTIFLRSSLAEPTKSTALAVLNQAASDLDTLAAQARTAGDLDAQKALERIAKRVKAADETDRDFGTAVCLLAQKFGFQDEAAMDAHLGSNPLSPKLTTWRSALTEYRNVNTHDAFHDLSNPAHAIDKLYGMNLHLLDLLVRILLAMSGYSGPYRPIPAIMAGTQKPLDWVKPITPARELGYSNLL